MSATPATAPDAFLAERANRIRQLGRAVVADVVEIGRVLIECRERLDHGAWLGWLQTEVAWSDQTARNFIHLAEMAANSKRVLDLDLPLRDLYLLAAPGTPAAARQEVIERAAGGEHLQHDDIAAIIAEHGEGLVMRAAKQLRAERAEARRTERLAEILEIAKVEGAGAQARHALGDDQAAGGNVEVVAGA